MVVGWMMTRYGAAAFFGYISIIMGIMTLYAIYRMSQRAAPNVEDTTSYTPVSPTASPVAVEVAQEVAIEASQDTEEDSTTDAA